MNENINRIISEKPWLIPTAVGVSAALSGFGVGFYFGRRTTTVVTEVVEEFDVDLEGPPVEDEEVRVELAPEDLDAIRERWASETPPEETIISERVLEPEEVREIVDEPDGPAEPDPEPEMETANIFARDTDGWDYDEELASRKGKEFYVIHRDEYYSQEADYVQNSITFYEGDTIMADSEDSPIYNFHRIIGPLKWGHGSDDPNVFYVRNDKLNAEYEVLRHTGSFTDVIMGLDIDSDRVARDEQRARAARRMRPSDDDTET